MKCPICKQETIGEDTQHWGPEYAHIRCVAAYSLGGCDARADLRAKIDRLQAIEAAAKTLRVASGAVLAAQVRTHGDGKSLSLPLPKEYAEEMNAAMLAQAEFYRLLDAGVLFNVRAKRGPTA